MAPNISGEMCGMSDAARHELSARNKFGSGAAKQCVAGLTPSCIGVVDEVIVVLLTGILNHPVLASNTNICVPNVILRCSN